MQISLPKVWTRDVISSLTFIWLLLFADLAYLILHGLCLIGGYFEIPDLRDPLLSLSYDRGYAEFYQYLKQLWISILLLLIFLRTKSIGFVIWAILFLFLMFDDALKLHERVGGLIAYKYEYISLFGLRPQDFGELTYLIIVGVSSLVLLLLFYIRGSGKFRQSTKQLFLLIIVLAFFGVIADILQQLTAEWRYIKELVGIVEDGGEMVAMSIITWYVYVLYLRKGDFIIFVFRPGRRKPFYSKK